MKRKIYLDCGFYAGITLRRYIDAGIIDKTWEIYVFEPNPEIKAEQRIEDHFSDFPVKLFRQAVWTKDGEVEFEIAGREDAASISGTSGHVTPKVITVPSIDFSKFVDDLPKAYILCSMDIEGAEFYVLPKMLEEHTIDKIDLLEIEFHHRLMADRDIDDAKKLIKEVKKRGVKVKLKDKLE